MVAVVVAPRIENPLSDVESVVTGGKFWVRPSKEYTAGGQWVQPVWSAEQRLNGSPVTIQLDPLASVPYEMKFEIPDGAGGKRRWTDFRIVTASGSPVPWENFVEVDGPGGTAPLTDVDRARITALEAQVGGISGGASNLASITDMSAFMRTVNDDSSAAAARATLVAADDGNTVHRTGTESITGVKTATDAWTFNVPVTVATPTANGHAVTKLYADNIVSSGTIADATSSIKGKIQLAGDLSGTAAAPTVVGLAAALSAIATLQAELNKAPWLHYPVSGVFPPRPATTRSVWFMSSTITPPSDGSVTGGGGMVPGLDNIAKSFT